MLDITNIEQIQLKAIFNLGNSINFFKVIESRNIVAIFMMFQRYCL